MYTDTQVGITTEKNPVVSRGRRLIYYFVGAGKLYRYYIEGIVDSGCPITAGADLQVVKELITGREFLVTVVTSLTY